MGEYFRLSTLLPEELVSVTGERWWRLPEWVFKPDAWTITFLRGLNKLSLTNESVWEVGVGSGIVSDFLRKRFAQIKLSFSDYDDRAVDLAIENLRDGGVLDRRLNPIDGSWDLISRSGSKTRSVDVMVGCIPQAPLPSGQQLLDGENLSHYYDASLYPESQLHYLGLGLNEALLVRAHQYGLNPGGRVVLNLAGRPTIACLLEMFTRSGYVPRILHEEIIEQHAGTCLEPFAALEREGSSFEFFADARGEQLITAAEAEARRINKEAVYHKIYVIEGKIT